eukprot:471452-Amorphochlora_amoeboformis.AAC.1
MSLTREQKEDLSRVQRMVRRFHYKSWNDCRHDLMGSFMLHGLMHALEHRTLGTVVENPWDEGKTKMPPDVLMTYTPERYQREILNTLVTEDDEAILNIKEGKATDEEKALQKKIQVIRIQRETLYSIIARATKSFHDVTTSREITDPMHLWAEIRFKQAGTRQEQIARHLEMCGKTVKDFSSVREAINHSMEVADNFIALQPFKREELLKAILINMFKPDENYRFVLEKACVDSRMTVEQLQVFIEGVKERGPTRKLSRIRRPKRPCFKCGSTKHVWRQCPKLEQGERCTYHGKRVKQQSPEAKRMIFSTESDSNEITLRSMVLRASQGNTVVINSGADAHCFKDETYFEIYQKYEGSMATKDTGMKIKGKFSVRIPLGGKKELYLRNVYHVPRCSYNLISMRMLTKDGYGYKIIGKEIGIVEKRAVIAVTRQQGGAFVLDVELPCSQEVKRITVQNQ